MATLTGQSIASSYEQLLHVDRDGGGNGTTHVSVKDGDNGTTFPITLATDAVMITSTNRLEFGDDASYIHQSADGVLDLVSDSEIELNATTIDVNGALDVSGDVTLSGTNTLLVSNGSAGSPRYAFSNSGTTGLFLPSSNALGIATNGVQRINISDAGLVGIGGSASAKLHIKQDNSTTDTTNGLLIENDGTGDAVAQFLLTGTKRWMMGIDNSDSDTFKIVQGVSDLGTADGLVMALDTSGNVGIGKSSAGQKLEIKGDHSGDGINTFYHNNTNPAWEIVAYGTDGGYIFGKNNSATVNVQIRTDGDSFLKGGNVGIGIAPVANKLHLHEGDSTQNFLHITNTTTGTTHDDGLLVGIDASEQANIWNRENTATLFATNNTERMRIDTSGNVGIGTTSPTHAKMEIVGDSDAFQLTMSDVADADDTTKEARIGMLHYKQAEEPVTLMYAQSGSSTNSIFIGGGTGVGNHATSVNIATASTYNSTSTTTNMKIDNNSRISLSNNDSNSNNTVFGKSAFNASADNGSDGNVAVGDLAMGTGTVSGAQNNIAIGYKALEDITSADANVAIGSSALGSITTGTGNTAIGYEALDAEDAGGRSTAVGYQALSAQNNDTGSNTAVGWTAGDSIVAGYANTLIGAESGTTGTNDLTSGIQNTLIGQATAVSAASTPTNQTVIGRGAVGLSNNSVTLGNSSVTDVYMADDVGATVHTAGILINATSQANNSQFTIENATLPMMTIKNTGTPDGSSSGARLDFNLANGTSKPTQTNDTVGNIVFLGQGNDADFGSASISNVITTGGNVGRSDQVSKLVFTTKNSGQNGADTALTINGDNTISLEAGINFPDNQVASADANTLDDYEEGYHTAVITAGTSGTITQNASFDQLAYTKVGRLVTVTGRLYLSAISSPVGTIRITMPFTVADLNERSESGAATVTMLNVTGANVADFVALFINGSAVLEIYLGDGTTVQSDSANALTATTEIFISAQYFTA